MSAPRFCLCSHQFKLRFELLHTACLRSSTEGSGECELGVSRRGIAARSMAAHGTHRTQAARRLAGTVHDSGARLTSADSASWPKAVRLSCDAHWAIWTAHEPLWAAALVPSICTASLLDAPPLSGDFAPACRTTAARALSFFTIGARLGRLGAGRPVSQRRAQAVMSSPLGFTRRSDGPLARRAGAAILHIPRKVTLHTVASADATCARPALLSMVQSRTQAGGSP